MTQISENRVFLKDYKEYPFNLEDIHLYFNIISKDEVTITTNYFFSRKDKTLKDSLVLKAGSLLKLLSIKIDGNELSETDYTLKDGVLTLQTDKDDFTLQTSVSINPSANSALMGLYFKQEMFTTQCEPEGFRQITFHPCRPDVLSVWKVQIEVGKGKFNTVLSNGNLTSVESLENGRELYTYKDPYKKPSYLFAMVVANLAKISDVYKSSIVDKEFELNIYSEEKNLHRLEFALKSLKLSMQFDEEEFGLPYDLDVFNIVSTDFFNFGAMENKGLNIFNSSCLLASIDTATDDDYYAIESIVAHEYFHNYTGNRVTCRDWFQLTLKEGLTVLRDQLFSEKVRKKSHVTIKRYERMTNVQFLEDKSSMSHPIRPQSYIEIDNFYTSTVYDKGAEVCRMLRTILGKENFVKAVKDYLSRFDGMAVTCDDFLAVMQEYTELDLSQFKLWYSQSGTPILHISAEHDRCNKYILKIKQENPKTADQEEKQPLLIPLKVALFSDTGKKTLNIDGKNQGTETIIYITKEYQEFEFKDIEFLPSLSINRGFTAPVEIKYDLKPEEINKIVELDDDSFNKYLVLKKYIMNHILDAIEAAEKGEEYTISNRIFKIYQKFLDHHFISYIDLVSYYISMPTYRDLELCYINKNQPIPVDLIVKILADFKKVFGVCFQDLISDQYHIISPNNDSADVQVACQRSAKLKFLEYLIATKSNSFDTEVLQLYKKNDNLTLKVGALRIANMLENEELREEIFALFLEKYKDQPLVIDKYLALQGAYSNKNVIANLKSIMENKEIFDLTNPNRVRYLIGSFASANPLYFHNLDGSGYEFFKDCIIKIDKVNGFLAASLAKVLTRWNYYDKTRQELMKKTINNILAIQGISKGLSEVLKSSIKAK